MSRPVRAVPLVLVVVLFTACASSGGLKRTALASEQLALSTQRLQTLEISLYEAGQLTPPQHIGWQQGFLVVGRSIQTLNAALRVANGQEIETSIRAALEALDALVVQAQGLDSNVRLALVAAVEGVRTILITLSTVEA